MPPPKIPILPEMLQLVWKHPHVVQTVRIAFFIWERIVHIGRSLPHVLFLVNYLVTNKCVLFVVTFSFIYIDILYLLQNPLYKALIQIATPFPALQSLLTKHFILLYVSAT